MRRLVGLGGLVSLGGLVGVAAHRATSTEYPWSRPGATASTILEDPQWPADFPITSEHLKRLDETVDTSFYAQPRMVHHIDDEARRALQAHYRAMLPRGGNLTRTRTRTLTLSLTLTLALTLSNPLPSILSATLAL